jgi:hypothetical protein
MPLKSFTYEFEELPLVTSGAFDACLVTGFAEIHYDMSGAWSIGDIGFEVVQRRNAIAPPSRQPRDDASRARAIAPQTLLLDPGDPIQMIIYHRLEHDWRARVQNCVEDRILDDCGDGGADVRLDRALALKREWT